MQWMHQRYKCKKAHQKETKWVCIQLACSRRPRAFQEAHRWNIQAKFYNENSHQYMKVTTQETLYHEDHGATLKHKCGKRIVALSLLSFSLMFYIFLFGLFSFFTAPFFQSGVSSWPVGELQSPSSFPHMGQCSNNDDHHTFNYLQLKNYNSTLRTKYDSM